MRSIFTAPRHASASDVASTDGDQPAVDNNVGYGFLAPASAQLEEKVTTDGDHPAADNNGGGELLEAAAAQPEAVEDAQCYYP